MDTKRHLKNAPITEAIFDFRVNPKQKFDANLLLNAEKILSDTYPKRDPLRQIEGKFGIEVVDNKTRFISPQDRGIQGYMFKSEDDKNIAQFRKEGFTYNRLKPYISWDNAINETKYLWNIYKQEAKPELITRIAVRYINHLQIPLGDLSDYITNPPRVPDGVPKQISSFLSRIVINDTEREIRANVTQALEKSLEANYVTIILDIDVYKVENYDVDDERIWLIFNRLRELKNLIFFSSITEKAVERYQ
jgi:uncharacterized protein (TIGR04255 family)